MSAIQEATTIIFNSPILTDLFDVVARLELLPDLGSESVTDSHSDFMLGIHWLSWLSEDITAYLTDILHNLHGEIRETKRKLADSQKSCIDRNFNGSYIDTKGRNFSECTFHRSVPLITRSKEIVQIETVFLVMHNLVLVLSKEPLLFAISVY